MEIFQEGDLFFDLLQPVWEVKCETSIYVDICFTDRVCGLRSRAYVAQECQVVDLLLCLYAVFCVSYDEPLQLPIDPFLQKDLVFFQVRSPFAIGVSADAKPVNDLLK
jgi:hypothetical protein